MKTVFKLIFAILSVRHYKDDTKILLNKIEARYQLERLLEKRVTK